MPAFQCGHTDGKFGGPKPLAASVRTIERALPPLKIVCSIRYFVGCHLVHDSLSDSKLLRDLRPSDPGAKSANALDGAHSTPCVLRVLKALSPPGGARGPSCEPRPSTQRGPTALLLAQEALSAH